MDIYVSTYGYMYIAKYNSYMYTNIVLVCMDRQIHTYKQYINISTYTQSTYAYSMHRISTHTYSTYRTSTYTYNTYTYVSNIILHICIHVNTHIYTSITTYIEVISTHTKAIRGHNKNTQSPSAMGYFRRENRQIFGSLHWLPPNLIPKILTLCPPSLSKF